MSERFFQACLVIILIPYSLIFIVLLWNEIGPSILARRKPGTE